MGARSADFVMSRRSFMLTLAGGCVLAGSGMLGLQGCSTSPPASPIILPSLPYDQAALEPHISGRTVELHYGKHHKGYVDKTNELVKDSQLSGLPIKEIIRQTAHSAGEEAIFNNAAQAWSHAFYWHSMRPGGSKPGGRLDKMIASSFGGYDVLKKEMATAAMTQFGSGWVWVILEGEKLKVTKTGNADNPLVHGQTPLLTIDVWEHAYYLDYQNRRADYATAVIDHLLNWDFAESNLNRS